MPHYILAIDQGTTSSRAIIYDDRSRPVASSQEQFPQHFPRDGWVEHEPEDIWQSTLRSCQVALNSAGLNATDISSIGITNQRETTLVWNRHTGEPVYRAIVWQDRRTAEYCRSLKDLGLQTIIRERTGLLLDPYFSATKLRWILDEVPGARDAAHRGELAFGTVDSWLLWKLSGGREHRTDATNASRTMLFNIHEQCWDRELLELFDIPDSVLPEVMHSADDFGKTDSAVLGAAVPVNGMAGDQQAAAFGQGCFDKGMVKSTYGTGCFLLLNTKDKAPVSQHQLLTTVAYRLPGETCYALEGSIFMAGAIMQWLRDGLGILKGVEESEQLAAAANPDLPVYLVPAFTGLGAPYWDADARGALYGLTRDCGREEITAAALSSVCFQTRDLLEAMAAEGITVSSLKVDGGMVTNNWFAQRLADVLNVQVERPVIIETTALGAAYLAGLHCGVWDSQEAISAQWRLDKRWLPSKDQRWRHKAYQGWLRAVKRTASRI